MTETSKVHTPSIEQHLPIGTTMTLSEMREWMAIGRDEQKRCFDRLIASYIERLNKKRT